LLDQRKSSAKKEGGRIDGLSVIPELFLILPVTKDYFTKKSPSDFNAQYSRQRAVSGAVINFLVKSGKTLYQFLDK